MSLFREKRDQKIKVNIWRPDPSKNEYGHASIETKDLYLSKWGSGKDDSSFFAAITSQGKASYMRRSDDVNAYGREPDFVISIKASKSEVKDIEAYMSKMIKDDKVWLGTANCADATNGGLKASKIANIKLKGEKQGDIISTPLEFIEKLREKAKQDPDRFKIERDEKKDLDKNPENIKGISKNDSQKDAHQVALDSHKSMAKGGKELAKSNERSPEVDLSV